jgi:hypothetical protein
LTGFGFASPEIQNGRPAEAAANDGRHGTVWAVMIPPVSIPTDISTFAKSANGANPRTDEISAITSAERIIWRLSIFKNTIDPRLREKFHKENRTASWADHCADENPTKMYGHGIKIPL